MSTKIFSRLAILGTIFWMFSAMAIVFPDGEGTTSYPGTPSAPKPKIQAEMMESIQSMSPEARQELLKVLLADPDMAIEAATILQDDVGSFN